MKKALLLITCVAMTGCAITQPEGKPWDWKPERIGDYGLNPGYSTSNGEPVWENN